LLAATRDCDRLETEREDWGGLEARQREGQHDAEERAPAAAPERLRGLLELVRDGDEHAAGNEDDEGQRHRGMYEGHRDEVVVEAELEERDGERDREDRDREHLR